MDDLKHDGPPICEYNVTALVNDESTASAPAELRSRRIRDWLKPINDYRAGMQDSPTARTAALRGHCADLLELAAHVAGAIHDAVEVTPMTVEKMEQYEPSIDIAIRLAKQITQVSQLEMRSSKREE